MSDLDKYSDEELQAELADRARGVKLAERKADAVEGDDYVGAARAVEAVAAKLEAEDPAISTEEATARAKAEVGHPDPFNTVNGYGAEAVEPTFNKPESEVKEGVASDRREVADDGVLAEDESAAAEAELDAPAATPAAEELAAEKGVDISEIEGSGKDGKVTKADVEGA